MGLCPGINGLQRELLGALYSFTIKILWEDHPQDL